MIRRYTFFVDGQKTLEFDDSKTVKELIEYAFNVFEYYEPAGIGLVTLFQCHHSKSYTGWFTRDTNSICADEIEMLNNQYYPNHGFIYYEEFEIR